MVYVFPLVNVPFTNPEIFPGAIGFDTGGGGVTIVVLSFFEQETIDTASTITKRKECLVFIVIFFTSPFTLHCFPLLIHSINPQSRGNWFDIFDNCVKLLHRDKFHIRVKGIFPIAPRNRK